MFVLEAKKQHLAKLKKVSHNLLKSDERVYNDALVSIVHPCLFRHTTSNLDSSVSEMHPCGERKLKNDVHTG